MPQQNLPPKNVLPHRPQQNLPPSRLSLKKTANKKTMQWTDPPRSYVVVYVGIKRAPAYYPTSRDPKFPAENRLKGAVEAACCLVEPPPHPALLPYKKATTYQRKTKASETVETVPSDL
jgi:hypothetical protein